MRQVREPGRAAVWLPALAALLACSPAPPRAEPAARPWILLVTLDTTRADAVEPEDPRAETPNLAALAARGVRYLQAYTTAPMTLPAHASMLTGLYPDEHGVHENDRRLRDDRATLAERLSRDGYATAAFVSGYPLDRQFGLARGFERYDDELGPGLAERAAGETTDRALAHLDSPGLGGRPLFLWVHYYDPHEPYAPPEPFRTRHAASPYRGEIAYMDRELGRLLRGFERRLGGRAARILVVGDHGEGLGEHGEALHGNLLYQGVMRVPLVVAGTGIAAGERREPVSVRRVFDTVLAWADGAASAERGLLAAADEVVLGEAMKPFLDYGWQPQVMGVAGRIKAIRAGDLEVYDVVADPGELRDLSGELRPDRGLLRAVEEYPLPGSTPAADEAAEELGDEERKRLASLGYVAGIARREPRPDAPSPRAMAHLFADLDRGSGLFVHEEYRLAIPIFERVLERDPGNLMVTLRLAVAHSVLGDGPRALDYFRRAGSIAPESLDVRHYLGMHHLRSGERERAEPLFAEVLARSPERLSALEALARIRREQGRLAEAAGLVERTVALRRDPAPALLELGELRMALGDTPGALRAFERARELQGEGFTGWLELGVLYLADRRLAEARDSLDRVPPAHPDFPLALFKRAQVSVLLGEPDAEARIRLAREHADATSGPLIDNEPLFSALSPGRGRGPSSPP